MSDPAPQHVRQVAFMPRANCTNRKLFKNVISIIDLLMDRAATLRYHSTESHRGVIYS